MRPENKVARKIFAQLEASRTWGAVIINTRSQPVTEDALKKNFNPDACAKSPASLQASCQFIFSVSYSLRTYFITPHGGEGPYSCWGPRPEPEALKSGNALHCCRRPQPTRRGHPPAKKVGRGGARARARPFFFGDAATGSILPNTFSSMFCSLLFRQGVLPRSF